MWWDFCNANKYNVFNSSINQILEFLQNLLDTKSCKYGTFNSHRSALSLILPGNIADDQVLKRYLKGIANLRPSAPRYNFTWDTEPLLTYLKSLFPLDTLSLQSLSAKLATLLLLSTGHRIQTIHSIILDNIITTPSGFTILITNKIKTSSIKSKQPCLNIPYFRENNSLCVASVLEFYINKTKNLRKSDQVKLFITTRHPFSAASKETISRWIKQTMFNAGINTSIFKPHSTRHASTSKAFLKGISLDVIRQTAGWSESSDTFARFYNRPVINNEQFAKTVIS